MHWVTLDNTVGYAQATRIINQFYVKHTWACSHLAM